MRPISAWMQHMSSNITVEARSTADGYGKPSYGAAVTYRAHISRERKLIRTASGEEVTSEQHIHVGTKDAIQPTARLTLSTADVGSTEAAAINPTILAVERRFDGNGPHHVVLHL